MYPWLVSKIPGPWPVKLLVVLAVLAGVFWLLMEFVYPWVSQQMPYTDVAV